MTMDRANPQLYLASNSPRRRALLDQLGLRYAVVAAQIEETPWPGETAEDYVTRVALEKVRAARELIASAPSLPLLGADTAVVIDGRILGKPAGAEEAAAMLGRLSGRTHRVLSAVAVSGAQECTALSASEVELRALREAEIRAYWRTGEPADKAGAYAIQGLGAIFVRALRGSYSGVMGLPIFETCALLAEAGVEVLGGTIRSRSRGRHEKL
jgi:septum formation protein